MGKIMGYLKQLSTEMVSYYKYIFLLTQSIDKCSHFIHGYFPMIGIHEFILDLSGLIHYNLYVTYLNQSDEHNGWRLFCDWLCSTQ